MYNSRRSGRPTTRLRRLSTDYDESEEDRAPKNKGSTTVGKATNKPPPAPVTRTRRGAAHQKPSAVIERSSPEETRQSIHLTVKASPSKLRQATSGPAPKTAVSTRNVVAGKRASRSRRTIVEVDSDEEEEEEEEEEQPDEMDVDEDEAKEEDEDEDAEGEEDDEMDAEGEEDDEMEDVAPAPRITVSKPVHDEIRVQPKKNAAPAPNVSTVGTKDISMLDDDDDDELSELESEEEEDEEEDEEGGDEDAEGEEEEEESPEQANDEDEEMDSDDESRDSMSRSNTPDLSKLTRRQRALVEETRDEGLMALSNEAQKKKHLTAEEHAMRRLEMARRRKNLSEKRNEEEKMDTINRLLKKQPPKRGRRAMVELTESGQEEEPEFEKPPALYVRYTQTTSGTRMAVPEEWLSSPVGSIFTAAVPASGRPYGGRMVEEVA